MPTIMQSGAAWLGAGLKSAAGRAVTFRRAGSEAATLTGWCGSRVYESVDDEGYATVLNGFDWEFVTADFPEGFTPRPGDWIVETLNGVERKYEVMPLRAGAALEDMDSSGLLTTAHTKRVA